MSKSSLVKLAVSSANCGSIHGSIDITRDKVGLEYILALKRQIDAIAEYLKRADLPDKVEVLEAKTVENPFG